MDEPPQPTKMFLLRFAMPTTSWGTTWPMESIRSYAGSSSRRLTSTSMESVTSPSDISDTYSPGTVPTFSTSLRQLCTMKRS